MADDHTKDSSQESDSSSNEDQTKGETQKADETAGTGENDSPTLEQLQEKLNAATAERDAARLQLWQSQQQGTADDDEPAAKEPVKGPLDNLSDDRLSQMTNRELIDTAVQAFSHKLESEVIPRIQKEIGSVGKSVAQQKAEADVARTAAKHSDFWNYRVEMVQLSQQPGYQSIGAEDLYLIAKAKKGGGTAPARATGAPAGQKSGEAAKRDARAQTEKPGASGGSGAKNEEGQMEADAAAEDAYEKAFGKK